MRDFRDAKTMAQTLRVSLNCLSEPASGDAAPHLRPRDRAAPGVIMQRLQLRRHRDPEISVERVVEGGRVEPRFGAGNDNAERDPDSGTWTDRHPISTG